MPRGSKGSSRGSSSSRSKPTTTAAGNTRPSQRPQTGVQPHSQQNTAAQKPAAQQPHAQQPAATPAPQAAGGSGLLGTIGSVAAGSFIGNVLADKWRGEGAPAEAAPAGAAGLDQQQQSPCAQYRLNFDQCVSQNPNSIASCQWTWDSYKECMNMNQQQNQNNWS